MEIFSNFNKTFNDKHGGKKPQAIELLSQTNDSTLINEVYDILHPEGTVENINMEELAGDLQQKINKALDDYKRGNYFTQEEMKQKLQQWLTQ